MGKSERRLEIPYTELTRSYTDIRIPPLFMEKERFTHLATFTHNQEEYFAIFPDLYVQKGHSDFMLILTPLVTSGLLLSGKSLPSKNSKDHIIIAKEKSYQHIWADFLVKEQGNKAPWDFLINTARKNHPHNYEPPYDEIHKLLIEHGPEIIKVPSLERSKEIAKEFIEPAKSLIGRGQ